MTKSNIMRSILIVSSALIIIGVTLMGWMMSTADERNVIKIQLKDGLAESVHFEQLAMVPGSSHEYVIKLRAGGSEQYTLTMQFEENAPTEERTLKNYAYVKIMTDQEVLCDTLLATLFESPAMILPVDFNKNLNTELTVIYYLPMDVGNEAKNAEAVFDLLLTAGNE